MRDLKSDAAAIARRVRRAIDPSTPEFPLRHVLSALVVDPRNIVAGVAAMLVLAASASAAITVVVNTSSRIDHTLGTPPVVWQPGPDSSGNENVASWSLSANATYFTVTLKPVPEAQAVWGNLTSLHNQGSTTRTINVTGDPVSAYPKILAYKLEFYHHGNNTLAGTLDLRQASPSADLGPLAAGGRMYVKATIKLDNGTIAGDVPASVSVSLTV